MLDLPSPLQTQGKISLPDQLHDIHGLDVIGWWPLAPGWWLVAGGVLLVLFVWVNVFHWLLHQPTGHWKREARNLLLDLRKRQSGQSPKKTAEELSELLRRISIARFGREECAALLGEGWLVWLKRHDPEDFDWPEHATLLLDLPFAPDQPKETDAQKENLQSLVKAALQMLAACHENP